ncbi:MAG: hypothetical protein AAB653_00370 [Patescibacteria group bacterium]
MLLLICLPILKASAGRTVQILKDVNDTLHVLGSLVVDGTISASVPTLSNHVATKGWVDARILSSNHMQTFTFGGTGCINNSTNSICQ